ncbi:Phosphoglucomutase/phosphomannomutase [Candidatus Burarchaeum australiense]|nr:Phosphoglucomutase/phosphomannomutase [Candidatus Burarchaeum australiense]
MAKYFGTNGVRGLLDLITPDFVSRMCAAFGHWSKCGKIVVARDTRTSGEMLEYAAIAGLLSAGCQVVRLGIAPSPTAEYQVLHQKANGAVVITASHNPPEWNAMKFVDARGIAVSRETGEGIERLFESRSRKAAPWNALRPIVKYPLACEDHANAVRKSVDPSVFKNAKPSLVLDCANGTMAKVGPALFKSLGCRVTTINANMDGTFPGRPGEPTEANIGDLIASVKALGADMGIAWDGDGDRVVFVDEKGKFVIGDRIFSLCADIALREKKGDVVTTVATTNAIRDIAAKYGSKVFYTGIGAPYLSEGVLTHDAVIGGEEVGGVVWPSLHFGKDGLMTAAKIVEAACAKPLSKLIAGLPVYYNSKTKIPCAPERKQRAMHAVAGFAKLAASKGKITTIDGIRVDFKDSWVIVRASGTENYLRIFAEAKTQEKAELLMKEYEAIAVKAAGQ